MLEGCVPKCWWWTRMFHMDVALDLWPQALTLDDMNAWMKWVRKHEATDAAAVATFLRHAVAHIVFKRDYDPTLLETAFLEYVVRAGATPLTLVINNLRSVPASAAKIFAAATIVHLPRCVSVAVGAFAWMSRVVSLDLNACTNVTDADLASMPCLRFLRLSGARGVTDAGLGARIAAGLEELVLGVDMEHITDAAFTLEAEHRLRKVVLYNHPHISADAMNGPLEYVEIHRNTDMLLSALLPRLASTLRTLILPHHLYMNAYVHSCYPNIQFVVAAQYQCY